MPYKEREITKKYWLIGELAKELRIETSAIRFWCKEFKIDATRRSGIARSFKADERDLIHRIHRLTKKGFTLAGIKKHFKQEDEIREEIHRIIITQRDDEAVEQIMRLIY